MAGTKRKFIPNQVFEKKYPLYFTIVGRNDGQDAKSLFEVIKTRVASSYAGMPMCRLSMAMLRGSKCREPFS